MTGPRCGTNGCPDTAHTRGYCHRHYRHRLHTGRYGLVDATPVIAHITALRDLGWTWLQIGDTAGVAWSTAYGVFTGRYQRMTADRAAAILAVPVAPAISHHGVDSCGTRRRVQALSWMGWPTHMVAAEAGIPATTLRTLILPTRRISRANAAKVTAVYERLSHVPGPSKVAAGKARGLGFFPPAAWDDDSIDHPDAQPDLGDHVAAPRVDLAEVEHLAAGGCHMKEIARRLGVSVWTIQRAQRAAEVAA